MHAPLPPLELATRVGPGASADPFEAYVQEGAAVRARVERLLPASWSWEGARVLDFGCGSARVLRHFLPEADEDEFWGCDIDAASIAWIEAHLSPPLRVFCNELAPPLPLEADSFDLVYATSVFTHIGDGWSDWLLEMHRILRPGGLLVASFLGEGMWEGLNGEPYREDEVGMTVRGHWTGADCCVFHSEWWLREHWGRAFDVVEVVRPPREADGSAQVTHSYIAVAKRGGAVSGETLERIDPAEERELAGLDTNVRRLRAELEALVAERDDPERRAAIHELRPAIRRAVLASPLGEPLRRVRARWR